MRAPASQLLNFTQFTDLQFCCQDGGEGLPDILADQTRRMQSGRAKGDRGAFTKINCLTEDKLRIFCRNQSVKNSLLYTLKTLL